MVYSKYFKLFLWGLFVALIIISSCKKDEEEDPANVGVTVTETDGSTDVTEGGNTDTYTVALQSAPGENVNIALTPDAQVTVDKALLTFTPNDWNVAQTVTVTAVDDPTPEGDHVGVINHTSTSFDMNWNNVNLPALNVNITDNDLSLIIAGSRTNHYVIVDPITGQDMVEHEASTHILGFNCLGYLSQKVVIISTVGPGSFMNALFTVDRATGANPTKLTDENMYNVRFVDASDAEPRLVFCAQDATNSKDHIYSINEDGTNMQQLTFQDEGITCPGGVACKIVGATEPSWSFDGTMIAFNGYISEIGTNFAHNSVVVMSAAGGNKTVIFDVQVAETHYEDICWSKDGQFVIFSYENNGRRVMAVHVGSQATSEFTSQMEVNGTAVMNLWTSPIENKIVYNIHVPAGGSLYMVNYNVAGTTASISGAHSQFTDAVAVGHGYAYPDWQSWDGK